MENSTSEFLSTYHFKLFFFFFFFCYFIIFSFLFFVVFTMERGGGGFSFIYYHESKISLIGRVIRRLLVNRPCHSQYSLKTTLLNKAATKYIKLLLQR